MIARHPRRPRARREATKARRLRARDRARARESNLARRRRRPTLKDLTAQAQRAATGDGLHSLEVAWTGPGRLEGDEEHYRLITIFSSESHHFEPGALDHRTSTPLRRLLKAPLPVPSGYFDIALCVDVLDKSPAPMEFMVELARTLRAGGHLYLHTPLVVGTEPQRPDLWQERVGINALLDGCQLVLKDLAPLRDTGGYGLVAMKSVR